jgi:hypothetical protein
MTDVVSGIAIGSAQQWLGKGVKDGFMDSRFMRLINWLINDGRHFF